MASFTRVKLPPGPERELLDFLTDLHIKAGEPTAKEICDKIKKRNEHNGISTDTVWRVMCGKQLTKWKYIERIVEVLDGQPEAIRPTFDAARTAVVAPHRPVCAEKEPALVESAKVAAPAPVPPVHHEPRSEASTEVEKKARKQVDHHLRTLKALPLNWVGRPARVQEIGASIIDVWEATEPPLRPRRTMPFTAASVEHLTNRDVFELVKHFHSKRYYELALQVTGEFARMGKVDAIKESIERFSRFDRILHSALLRTIAQTRAGDIPSFQDIDLGSFTALMDHLTEANTLRAGSSGPSLIAPARAGRRVLPAPPPRIALE